MGDGQGPEDFCLSTLSQTNGSLLPEVSGLLRPIDRPRHPKNTTAGYSPSRLLYKSAYFAGSIGEFAGASRARPLQDAAGQGPTLRCSPQPIRVDQPHVELRIVPSKEHGIHKWWARGGVERRLLAK